MVDQILKTLLQQRIMAAKDFLGFCPVGSYYDYKGQICIVTGYDAKTGFLNFQPTGGGGALINPDPIGIMFPNAVANPAPVTAALAPQTSMLSTLGSAAPAALSGLPALAGLKKGAAAKAGVLAGGPHYTSTGAFAEINPNVGSLDLVKGSAGVAKNATSAAKQLLSLNDKANLGLLSPDQITTLAQGAAEKAWTDQIAVLKQDIGTVNDQIAALQAPYKNFDAIYNNLVDKNKLADPFSNLSTSLPDVPSNTNPLAGDVTDLSNPFPSTSDPSLPSVPSNPFGGDPLNITKLSSPFGDTPQLSPSDSVMLKSYEIQNAASQQQLSQLQAGHDEFVAAYVQKTQDAATAATQATAYDKEIQLALNQPPSDGQTSLATAEIRQQYGSKIQLNSDGTADTSDPFTAKTLSDQIKADTADALAQTGGVGQADQISSKYADYQSYLAGQKADAINKQLLHAAELKFGIELALAAAAAYGEERAFDSIFHNGLSAKNLIGAAIAAGTLIGLMHSIHGMLADGQSMMVWLTSHLDNILGVDLGQHLQSLLHFMTGGWGILFVQAAIIFFGWLFGHSQSSPEQQAAEQLNAELNPVVWNPNGQVIFLTAGLTMASMGLNLGPTAPMMQTMTMTSAQATQALTNAGAGSVPTDSTRYADVFVKQGAPGQATQVVWLTPVGTDKHGNVIEKVTVDTLNKNFQFATSQPPTGYIPIFINGPGGTPIPNPLAFQNLAAQQHLLQCADGTWVTDASRCVNGASVQSHNGGS